MSTKFYKLSTKRIYRGPKGNVDRFLISVRGNFKCNVRRGLELCKEMGIDCVEFADEQHLAACIEVGVEGVVTDGKALGTVVTIPNDVKDGYYEGYSPEKLRMQVYGVLMQENAFLIDYMLKKN